MTVREWSATISDDPRTIVALARVAEVVNEFFHLDPDDVVAYDTPFVWWDRSKRNHGISHPMPTPFGYASANGRAPLFFQEQIVHWFGDWRGLEVPECRQAGDGHDSRGRFKPSVYRNG